MQTFEYYALTLDGRNMQAAHDLLEGRKSGAGAVAPQTDSAMQNGCRRIPSSQVAPTPELSTSRLGARS